MKLTNEQLTILNAVKQKTPLIKVVAFAGTGKTTLLYEIAKHIKGRKLYLAFNKAIQLEANEKFVGTNTIVKTTHSLAYNFVIHRYGYKLKRGYSTMELTQIYSVDYKTAYEGKIIFENFCNSASSGFSSENMTPAKQLATQIFEDMLTKKIDVTHSFYLKKFQLDLLTQNITLPMYDMILLDEAQDTNDVTLSIFYNIPAKQKIIVGDRHQQIYSFRGSINAINKIKAQIFYLTHSFRFNEKIAFKATNFLKIFKNEKQSLKGLGKNNKIKTKAIISRTNAELILQMKYLIEDKKEFKTIREPYDIFGLALNIYNLSNGDEVENEYKYLNSFKNEYKFLSKAKKENYDNDILKYIEEAVEDDIEFLSAIKVAKTTNLEKIYQIAKENYQKNSNIYLTTAHTSKGLEFDEVKVCDDFLCYKSIAMWFLENEILNKPDIGYLEYFKLNCKEQKYIDELNLYYVAITRAKSKLIDKTDFNYLTDEIAELEIESEIKEFLNENNKI
jgi:superfamily I DNA/RNA helicase